MRADDGADEDGFDGAEVGHALADEGFEALDVVLGVRVHQNDLLPGGVYDVFGGFIRQIAQGGLAAADFVFGDHGTVLGEGEDGFQIHERAHGGGHGADAPAALQIHQIVHRKPGLGTQLVVFHPLGDRFHGLAFLVQGVGSFHEQGHRAGDGQRIHDYDFTVRVQREHLLARLFGVFLRCGHFGGERDEQDVLAGL